MLNKIDLIISVACIAGIVAAIYLVQARFQSADQSDLQQAAQIPKAGLKVVDQSANDPETTDAKNSLDDNRVNFFIEDIKFGQGDSVETGDTVLIHYSGRLLSGKEFDDSRKRGEAQKITVGGLGVLNGLSKGLLGMRQGGERIIVMSPEMLEGKIGNFLIPAEETIVLKVELLEIS